MREEEEEEGTKNVQGSLPKREAPINSSDISCQASTTTSMKAKENFLTTLTQFSLFCPKKQLSNNIARSSP